jgi:hypothetical protein
MCASHPAGKPNRFRLEGVSVCVGYSDFLAHTLPLNKHQFDDLIIVTVPEDKDTQRVCRYYDVQCLPTDVIRSRWPKEFHKGKGINEGLQKLSLSGWVVHFDTDVILPPHYRKTVAGADLDRSMIYGCDRIEFKSWADFQRFHGDPALQVDGDYNCFINVSQCFPRQTIGTRVAFFHKGGYLPIGFMQLWNPAGSAIWKYQDGHNDASMEDNLFAMQWPRARRGFLPEVLCYHLESEPAAMAVNWKGRQTKKFRIQD